ncbi:MAG: double-strand break repair helicase AddA [Pseudomonadota bacterium]
MTVIVPAHIMASPSDATSRQVMAADATASVWVDASAGTGKTKVLVDRVLRLLLPRNDGTAATPPNRILCLTFTNAAAAEMIGRIQSASKSWLTLDNAALQKTLSGLLGITPHPAQLIAARQLFATIVDTPGGLKVTTLHAFSQSILRRFPIEAGLSPALQLADEGQAIALLEAARNTVFKRVESGTDPALQEKCRRLLHITGATRLTKIMTTVLEERRWLQSFFAARPSQESIISALYTGWKIAAPSEPDLFWNKVVLNRKMLRQVHDALVSVNTLRPLKLAARINGLLTLPDSEWPQSRAIYTDIFLTKEGSVSRHNIDDVTKADETLLESYMHAADDLQRALEDQAVHDMAIATADLLGVSHAILTEYEALKRQKNTLDFDDQILTTRTLLESNATWVMYKLDQGIDHILVDEAQDTNPDQWGIITALAMEFFVGHSAQNDRMRTLFTVGDEKQAIYGFQRANPDDFGQARTRFDTALAQTGQELRQVPLDTSFRSGPAVLHFVDTLMNLEAVRTGLISAPTAIAHTAHREGAGGRIGVWPVFSDREADATPLQAVDGDVQSGATGLVAHITDTIRDWLDTQRPLVARGRPIRAGDILILLRKRGRLQTMLVRALRQKGIAVSGLDRMNLTDTMVAQDMFHVAKIALQPLDDYSLAGVLKSPFLGVNEETLYDLATTRDKDESLWARLQRAPDMAETVTWLRHCMNRALTLNAYDFFAALLHSPCPQARSGWYALQRRLGHDIAEIVNALLDHALSLQSTKTDILGFITACQAAPPSIKRQISPGMEDSVTVMTVHAAKGLEAPIVILADARGPRSEAGSGFIWPHESGLDMPLWTAQGRHATLAQTAGARKKSREEAESRRLLYVALTRARDEAYITGYTAQKTKAEPTDDWYAYCSQAMRAIQTPPPSFTLHDDGAGTLMLSRPQTGACEIGKDEAAQDKVSPVIPAWLDHAAPNAVFSAPQMLQPSHLGKDIRPVAMSPLAGQQQHRFARGIHTHTLLQHLPNCPPAMRVQAAVQYLDRYATDLPADVREQIAKEVLRLLTHPDLVYLFSEDALAEVPVSGQLADGTWMNGQMDRLVVMPDRVLVLDYKTNRPPPRLVQDVPLVYRRQMATYRELLARIYPGRPITCFLLWTDGPILMEIPHE